MQPTRRERVPSVLSKHTIHNDKFKQTHHSRLHKIRQEHQRRERFQHFIRLEPRPNMTMLFLSNTTSTLPYALLSSPQFLQFNTSGSLRLQSVICNLMYASPVGISKL